MNNLKPTLSDYEKAFKDFKAVLTTNYEVESYPPGKAKDKTFGTEFPGGLIYKPDYKDCKFIESRFESSDGANSKFHDCFFYDCLFNNCDLRYCDINNSSFQSIQNKLIISDCSFDFGNFINVQFLKVPFSGCSFRQMQLINTSFKQCTMSWSSFEQSSIKSCIFEDLDLRFVGVRYCNFEDTTFDNVIFHILDLPRNYGLVEQLRKSSKPVYVAYENDKLMPLDEAVNYLIRLTLYYEKTQRFYELINVHILHKKYYEIRRDFELALQSVVFSCDFAALQDICSLIVKLNIYSNNQLQEFYSNIRYKFDKVKLSHYIQKSYNTYIENIRCILVDNPYNKPTINILLKTDIISLNDKGMIELLSVIEGSIERLAPNSDTKIQLTHHSPYEVLLTLIGALPEIQSVCQVFYYFIGGVKALSDFNNEHKESISQNDVKQPSIKNKDNEVIKRFKISIGNAIFFTYETEFKQHVQSMDIIK